MKHPHYDVILAFLQGKTVQHCVKGQWYDVIPEPSKPTPMWSPHAKWRVKRQGKTILSRRYVTKVNNKVFVCNTEEQVDEVTSKGLVKEWIDTEWNMFTTMK